MTRHGPVAVLIGFMGAGKSTVGRELAARLRVPFCDTDTEIERRTGRSIPQIFADDGEPAFRELEAQVVTDVLAGHDGVVALGGGSVMTPAIREALTGHPVVYLELDAVTGFDRVRHSDRPLLAEADPAARYADLLDRRRPVYAAVADITVAADRSAVELAAALVTALREHAAGPTAHRTPPTEKSEEA